MRFDAERVVSLADSFAYARRDATEGEQRAADAIAGHLEEAGLRVERTPAPVLNWPPWIIGLLFVFDFGFLAMIAPGDIPRLHRAWLIGVLLTPVGLLAWWKERTNRRAGWTGRSEQIIATPAKEHPQLPRILFITRLVTDAPAWRSVPWLFTVSAVTAMGFVFLTPWHERQGSHDPEIALLLLGACWLATTLVLLWWPTGPGRPVRGDNRTGLALLAELARTWPRGLAGRVDAWFIASPNRRNLGCQLQQRPGSDRPTLVIVLGSPGVGNAITVAGRGPAHALALAAARDLWLPHRSSSWRLPRFLEGLQRPPMFRVDLLGRRDDSPINPALLTAIVQLTTEVTLRWLKQFAAKSGAPAGL